MLCQRCFGGTFAVLLLAWAGVASAAEAACSASSGATRIALLELYTSEGCSSCPPADRWLSALHERPQAAQRLAPLAFHVDYWNRLGWADRFSKPSYSARQRWIAAVNRARTVYTPQFVLDGRDWRPLRTGLPPPAPTARRPGSSGCGCGRSRTAAWKSAARPDCR